MHPSAGSRHEVLPAAARSDETTIDRWSMLAPVDALAVNIANLRLAGGADCFRVQKESLDADRR